MDHLEDPRLLYMYRAMTYVLYKSFLLTVCLSVRFLWIGSLVFFLKLDRVPFEVVHDRQYFWKLFWILFKKFFSGFGLQGKLIFYFPAQIPCQEKIRFLRYGRKCFCPIKLLDSLSVKPQERSERLSWIFAWRFFASWYYHFWWAWLDIPKIPISL